MYESLTAFIPGLENGNFGGWTEQTGDGTSENPYVFCHIEYSEPADGLIKALFGFRRAHKEMDIFHCPDLMDEVESLLKKTGEDPDDMDVSATEGRLVVGLLHYLLSMCRFDDGLFLRFCENGTVLRCLKRLREIDESGEEPQQKKETETRISAGDYVKVRDTGRIGEALDRNGKSIRVEFREPGEDPVEEQITESRLERLDYPELDAEQVRDLVRGNTEVLALAWDPDCMLDMKTGAAYTVTAEDLLEGIRRVKQDRQAANAWAEQLLYWMNEDCQGNIWPEDAESGTGRLLREESVLLCVCNMLDRAVNDLEDGDDESFIHRLTGAENLLLTWLEAGADIGRLNEYPDDMLRWLIWGDNEDTIDARNEERQRTFRECLDILCERGDADAVAKRGYCYYCGTGIYPQNWEAAGKAFLYVYEKTGAAWPANTLGYIYYYGRCNNGVPEYEKAFHWFSIGHAGGVDESTYKLGDLYANGYGVVKNGSIAYNLYLKVYQDTLNIFLTGASETKFADAAIRMGNCCRDGIWCSPDPEEAYTYYLQAMKALKMRMESCSYYGDGSVLSRLTETIGSIRKVYTDHAKVMKAEEPFWLYWILDRDHQACRMTWKTLKDGKLSLTCTRAPDTKNETDFILATFPAGDYCELLRKITIQTEKDARLTTEDGTGEIIFDDFDYYWYDNSVELKRTGKTVAEIRTTGYRFRPTPKRNE